MAEMTELQKMGAEIEESIRKNLPANVGEILRKELAELDRLRNVDTINKDLAKKNEYQAKEIQKNEAIVREYQSREADLVRRETEVKTKENDLEISILKIKLEEANKRADIGKELVSLVFKNREIVTSKSIQSTIHPSYDSSGRQTGSQSVPVSEQTVSTGDIPTGTP